MTDSLARLLQVIAAKRKHVGIARRMHLAENHEAQREMVAIDAAQRYLVAGVPSVARHQHSARKRAATLAIPCSSRLSGQIIIGKDVDDLLALGDGKNLIAHVAIGR